MRKIMKKIVLLNVLAAMLIFNLTACGKADRNLNKFLDELNDRAEDASVDEVETDDVEEVLDDVAEEEDVEEEDGKDEKYDANVDEISKLQSYYDPELYIKNVEKTENGDFVLTVDVYNPVMVPAETIEYDSDTWIIEGEIYTVVDKEPYLNALGSYFLLAKGTDSSAEAEYYVLDENDFYTAETIYEYTDEEGNNFDFLRDMNSGQCVLKCVEENLELTVDSDCKVGIIEYGSGDTDAVEVAEQVTEQRLDGYLTNTTYIVSMENFLDIYNKQDAWWNGFNFEIVDGKITYIEEIYGA